MTNQRGTGMRSNKYSWRLYGDEVVSDIAACDLPNSTGAKPSVVVAAAVEPMPSRAELLR